MGGLGAMGEGGQKYKLTVIRKTKHNGMSLLSKLLLSNRFFWDKLDSDNKGCLDLFQCVFFCVLH